ncbi:hypothetical protein [Paenibacillus sp. HB172176]|uniref:hypothetical protein n=1 Tax=Paenibacillus sp. HB172176 TaxID=2493690 RepID=UPI00143BDF1F|nr:hypothetical protein [Paenibacillus sp. HB172176]
MTSHQHPHTLDPIEGKLKAIMDPEYPLTRSDVVWMLGYIKKRVADADPLLTDLSQPRLLQNFLYFAEIAMSLIQRRNACDQEADRMREWLRQAAYGLLPDNP